jgi:hypothetical protein
MSLNVDSINQSEAEFENLPKKFYGTLLQKIGGELLENGYDKKELTWLWQVIDYVNAKVKEEEFVEI